MADISSLAQGLYVACDADDVNKYCLAPGTYRLSGGPSVWPVTVTIDVPARWSNRGVDGFDGDVVPGGRPDDAGTGWGVMFTTVGDDVTHPVMSRRASSAAKVETPGARCGDGQVAELEESRPQAITVDGHPGLTIVRRRPLPAPARRSG